VAFVHKLFSRIGSDKVRLKADTTYCGIGKKDPTTKARRTRRLSSDKNILRVLCVFFVVQPGLRTYYGIVKIALVTSVLFAVCGSVASAHAEELIDRVMAIVAGDLILLSDVRAAREFGLVGSAGAESDREVLSGLINRSLMLAEVDRYAPPEPGADAIQAGLKAIEGRFESAQQFDAALARVGLDKEHLRSVLRNDLRIQAYLDQRFSAETTERQRELVAEWLAGLRRRADIIDLDAGR
jgi:hypothetical protein